MAIKKLTDKELDEILDDVYQRVELAKSSFFHFCLIYLADNFELEPAVFHRDIFDALESVDDIDRFLSIMGFRGCAKSTILEAFAIWSMLNEKHNYIVWIGNTMDDSKESLANIKAEIEENEDLRKDFDIVLATDDTKDKRYDITQKWSEKQLIIGDCTIVAKSRMGKLRGKKFKKARIDLIICDDLEDIETADTVEKRAATRKWFYAEVMQATKQGTLATDTKVVMLGNLVHRDCLVKQFGSSDHVKFMEFPLLDKVTGEITWTALYPDMEAIEKKKEEVLMAGEGMGHVIWAREYLLIDADEEDMVLKLSDIQYYPDEWLQKKANKSGVGVDFAISKKEKADYTAMVKGMEVSDDNGERKLLIMKNNFASRVDFTETIKKAVEINELMPIGTKFYPEKVNYQEAAHEIMRKNGINVVPMSATGDKKSRIASACFYIKQGRVLFPKDGAQDVIDNLVGFGIEEHDDIADACAYLILGMVKGGGVLFA